MAQRAPGQKREPAEFIVGIGGSAGSLDALKAFFAEMSPRSGLAYVVVQHMEHGTEQLLVDALAGVTKMSVGEVTDKIPAEHNCIYVAPGGASVAVSKTLLTFSKSEAEDSPHASIDHFFYSLADQKQSDAIGVVLSGAGSDGTLGLKAISDAGGMTMVQSPESAKYDAMPRSAITSGVVDHVLPPGEMPKELMAYLRHLHKTDEKRERALRDDIADAIPAIAEVLQRRTDHNFQHYKTTTLVRRIRRRMQVLRTASVDRYVKRLRSDEEESAALFRDLLISVTAFFRDPEAFEALAEQAITDVLRRSNRTGPVRIWVPGCASGEEAYTMAMLCREKMDELKKNPEVQIFATDIDTRALGVARRGTYPAGIAEDLKPQRLKRFFVKRSRRYQVTKEVRELCLFSLHNLIGDPPFSRLDLISCRNLLIYLGPHLQKKLMPLFHYALRPGGYLFLGPSENISSHRELFRTVSAEHRISQRNAVTDGSTNRPAAGERRGRAAQTLGVAANENIDLHQIGQRIVLDEFAPQWAIVNEEAQILTLSSEAGKYLQLTGGHFQNNIIKMARTGLRVGLRAALNEAIKRRRQVDHENVSLRAEGGLQRMMLTVQPMPQAGEDSALFMVVFRRLGTVVRSEDGALQSSDDSNSTIEQLERELGSTRDDLETSIQDLEAANEELKSSNEELRSMNEELQSANEELEASKEEVQAGAKALARAKSDLENLLRSTAIATLFLDEELNIQSFTPAVSEIYNLIDSDVGRPIWHQTHHAVEMPAIPSAATIQQSREPIEDTIETTDGRFFTRRVLPYRTHQGKREGIVVTFTDVSRLHETLRKLERRERQAAVLADLGRAGLVCADLRSLFDQAAEQVAQALDNEFCKVLKLLPGGGEALMVSSVGWNQGLAGKATVDTGLDSQAGFTLKAAEPVIVEDLRTDERFSGPGLVTDHGVTSGMSVVIGPRDRPWGVLGTHTARRTKFTADDTNFIQAVANILWEAIDSYREEQRFRALVEASAQIVWTTNSSGEAVEDSPSWRAFTGQSYEQWAGFGWLDVFHPDDRARVESLWRDAVATTSPVSTEYRVRHNSGKWRWMEVRAVPLTEPDGSVRGWVGMNIDVTDRKQVEQLLRDSQERLRAFLDNTRVIAWMKDEDGDHVFLSSNYERRFGVRLADVRGKTDQQLWPREIADEFRRKDLAVLADNHPKEVIESARNPDGSTSFWLTNRFPFQDADGNRYVGGLAVDITERAHAEQMLRQSEERLRLAAGAANFGTYDVDFVAKNIYWSAEMKRICGLEADASVPVHPGEVPEFVHPEDRKRVGQAIRESLDPQGSGNYNDEHRVVLPDGKIRWVLLRGRTYFEDKNGRRQAVRAAGIVLNVTQQKKAERALREAEERARLLLASTGEAIYGLDREGNCTFCNPACIRTLGYPDENALLGRSLHELIHHTRADGSAYPRQECRMLQAVRHGQNIHVDDEVLWRADGNCFPAEYWSQPIKRDGQIVGAVVTFLDITRRKQDEKRLLEADRHKDEFIAMLAHELRNPLAPIRNAAQVFELVDLGDETLVEMRDIIKRQVEHMARLLDDLLDISRIARGKIELKRERTDLCRLVRTTAEDLRGTFHERLIKLTVHVPDEPLMADVDPTRISQTVGNLLQNAVKFTDEDGSVRVEVARANHDEVTIAVRDNGIGMEPEFVEHLFEPFRQADRSLHRSPGGLGLGLAMVNGIVELHGGRVCATSEGPGRGSQFAIHLPLEVPS